MNTLNDIYINGVAKLITLHFGLEGNAQLTLIGALMLVVMACAYMLGSINPAVIISKLRYGTDIRTLGSGNAGSTNMLRNFGKGAAALTFAGDIFKCVVSVMLGRLLLGETGAYLAGLFCIVGHVLPCWYGFKGGKGVASAAAMILAVDPMVFLVLVVIFAIVLLIWRYVSLASIIAAFIYPAVVYIRYEIVGSVPNPFLMICTVTVAFIIIFMHRENLKRLYRGRERKISVGKKNKLSPEEFEAQAKKRYDDDEYVDYDEKQ